MREPQDQDTSPQSPARLLFCVLVGLVLASGAAVVFIFQKNPASGSAEMELLKAALQVGTIAGATSFLAVLATKYQMAQQREAAAVERTRQEAADKLEDLRRRLEYRHDLLAAVLDKATKGYSSVKKARRVLRARGRKQSNKEIILTAVYDAQMDVVNDAQLAFENLQRDVENSKAAFTQPDAVVRALKSIDSYLGKLIREYEQERPGFNPDESVKRLSELPRLQDFLAPSKREPELATVGVAAGSSADDDQFTKHAVHAFHDVQRLLRGDLLHPHLVASLEGIGEARSTGAV